MKFPLCFVCTIVCVAGVFGDSIVGHHVQHASLDFGRVCIYKILHRSNLMMLCVSVLARRCPFPDFATYTFRTVTSARFRLWRLNFGSKRTPPSSSDKKTATDSILRRKKNGKPTSARNIARKAKLQTLPTLNQDTINQTFATINQTFPV